MKTISIEVGKNPKEVRNTFSKNKISPGDKVIVLAKKEEAKLVLLMFMVIIAMSLIAAMKQQMKKMGEHKADLDDIPGMSNEALLNMETLEEMEEAIETNLGVKIEVAIKEENNDPIEGLFGIWKNRDVNLEKIRKKAWERA